MLPLQPQALGLLPAFLQRLIEHLINVAAAAAVVEGLPEQGDGAAVLPHHIGEHPLAADHIRQLRRQLARLLGAAARLLTHPQPHMLVRLPAVQTGLGVGEQRLGPGGGVVASGSAHPAQQLAGQPLGLRPVVVAALIEQGVKAQGEIGIQAGPVNDGPPAADGLLRRLPLQGLLAGQEQQRTAQRRQRRHSGQQGTFVAQQQQAGVEQVLLAQLLEQLQGQGQLPLRQIPLLQIEQRSRALLGAGGEGEGNGHAGRVIGRLQRSSGGAGIACFQRGPGPPDATEVAGGGRTGHLPELAPGIGGVAVQQAERAGGPVELLGLEALALLADQLAHPQRLPGDQQQLEIASAVLYGQGAGLEAPLQQRQAPLRLAPHQPVPRQQVVRLPLQPQLHRLGEGLFSPLRLPLLQRLPTLQAPQLGLAGSQFQIGMAPQGLLAHPDGLAVALSCHQVRQLGPQDLVFACAADGSLTPSR